MGGCYNSSPSTCSPARTTRTRTQAEINKQNISRNIGGFFRTGDLKYLLKAYDMHYKLKNTSAGFFKRIYAYQKVDINNPLKEFPKIEYEIKFDIQPEFTGKTEKEPTIEQYLDAFEFPAIQNVRFLKDSANNILDGINHFYGEGVEERLVVIEKAGKTYLKEKSQQLSLNAGIPYEKIIVKRTENRWQAPLNEIIQKVEQVKNDGADYKGNIRKEKGDAFILDTTYGRIYSFTITRAHLRKPGENKESGIQRQLELEYAGHLPGFKAFKKNNEAQLITGMIDLAKYVTFFYNGAQITPNCKMNLHLTNERKYDFVSGEKAIENKAQQFSLEDGLVNRLKTMNVLESVKAKVKA